MSVICKVGVFEAKKLGPLMPLYFKLFTASQKMSVMVTLERQALWKILDNFKQCLITKQENDAHFFSPKIFNYFDMLKDAQGLGENDRIPKFLSRRPFKVI